MKPGYKQTEVGVIPEEWEVSQLGAIAATASGTTPARAMQERYYRNGSIAWVKTMDLNNSEISSTSEQVTELALKETCLRVYPIGTVLVAMYGGFQQIGRTGLLRIPATVNQAISAVQPDSTKLVSEYLLATLNHRVDYWKRVASSSRKDPNINSQDIRNFPIAYPPPPEQRAIAEALSDVDGLLGGLDRLIAKKRDLKQAAMQQLLTGQTRLPDFHGEWDKTKVGSVVREGRKTQRHAGTGEKSGLYRFFTNNTQDDEMFLNQFDFDGEAVIANTGGTAFFQYFRGKFAASMHCLILFSEINVKFLYFALKLRELEINESCFQGSGLKVLNKKALRDIVLTLPRSIEEQSAIVDVLARMDAELAVLQTRRDKTALLKQGMMKELLTGRIRLTPSEVRHA